MKERIQYQANNPVYVMGLVGAIFYYFSTATSFGAGVVGFLKAIFWPALLVYEALKTMAA